MSASNGFETAYLNLILANVNFTEFGLSNTGSITNVYLSLHTADPGEAGTQLTSEATYTGYARVAVVRSAGGWTVSGNTASNTAVVDFPICTGGSNTITHFGIGTLATTAGFLAFSGALTSSLSVSNNITPSFDIGDLTVVAD